MRQLLVLSYFFSACFSVYLLCLETACLQLGAVVRLGVEALDRVFLACNSYTFGVPNPSITFNHLIVIVLSTTFLQVGFPSRLLIWHTARRSYTVSLNLLHNLHCSWSVIPRIFFHLIVSIIWCCWFKIAAVFLGSALQWKHLCSSSSTFSSSSLWTFFSLKFFFLFYSPHPSSMYFLNFFHASFQLLHRCSTILTAPTSKSTSWFTSSIGCFAICRCRHVTCNSYFSLLVYVNKTPKPSTSVFIFCT